MGRYLGGFTQSSGRYKNDAAHYPAGFGGWRDIGFSDRGDYHLHSGTGHLAPSRLVRAGRVCTGLYAQGPVLADEQLAELCASLDLELHTGADCSVAAGFFQALPAVRALF